MMRYKNQLKVLISHIIRWISKLVLILNLLYKLTYTHAYTSTYAHTYTHTRINKQMQKYKEIAIVTLYSKSGMLVTFLRYETNRNYVSNWFVQLHLFSKNYVPFSNNIYLQNLISPAIRIFTVIAKETQYWGYHFLNKNHVIRR